MDVSRNVEEWLRAKGAFNCPLCRQAVWKFDELQRVVVIGAGGARSIGLEPQSTVGRPRDLAETLSALGGELRRLRSQLRVFRNAAEFAPLFQLKCGNCGYVLLLDTEAVRGGPEESPPPEPPV